MCSGLNLFLLVVPRKTETKIGADQSEAACQSRRGLGRRVRGVTEITPGALGTRETMMQDCSVAVPGATQTPLAWRYVAAPWDKLGRER